MTYEQNDCCDCAVPAYPCRGNTCPLRHVIYYRCDWCGADELGEDDIVDVDGEDVCKECYEKEFPNEE